jgi:hypothetical protein
MSALTSSSFCADTCENLSIADLSVKAYFEFTIVVMNTEKRILVVLVHVASGCFNDFCRTRSLVLKASTKQTAYALVREPLCSWKILNCWQTMHACMQRKHFRVIRLWQPRLINTSTEAHAVLTVESFNQFSTHGESENECLDIQDYQMKRLDLTFSGTNWINKETIQKEGFLALNINFVSFFSLAFLIKFNVDSCV